MKQIFVFLFISAILLTGYSCYPEYYFPVRFGFDSPIDKNSNGLVIADISQHVERIYLIGFISIEEGEVELNLLNPNGVATYTKTLVAPIKFEINETFDAIPGYWKLKYKCNEGIGEIDLQLLY